MKKDYQKIFKKFKKKLKKKLKKNFKKNPKKIQITEKETNSIYMKTFTYPAR